MKENITTKTCYGNTVDDYHKSVFSGEKSNNMFTLEYQWEDKPHRHVGDLCKWIKKLQKEIEILSEILKEAADSVKVSTVEEGISDYRRKYQKNLESRLRVMANLKPSNK